MDRVEAQSAHLAEEGHIARLRAELLRGGRLVKVKGILASIAPSLAGASLVAGLAVAQPALAADVTITNPPSNAPVVVQSPGVDNVTITSTGLITNGADTNHAPVYINTNASSKAITVDVHDVTTTAGTNGGIFINTAGTGDVTVKSDGDITGTNRGINITDTGSGNISLISTGTITGPAGGVRIVGSSQPGFNVDVHVNEVTTSTNVGAALDVNNTSVGGTTTLTADGTLTNTAGHTIRINGVDGVVAGAVGGPLIINVKDVVSGSRANPSDLFTSGGADGIQLIGAVGSTAAQQSTTITTGNVDATGTGVNLGYAINRVDGPTTVTTGNITAGGAGVVIESNDNSHNYEINVKTGDVTTGSTGITVNQSGTGSISVETGDVNAGTVASGANGFQNAGGYGIRLDSDPHGATVAGPGGADWTVKAGNVTVTDRSTGNLAGTGIALGTIQNGGNGDTTVTAGNIQAGTGVIYNRNGTGAVSLTTGDITAATGNGIQYGTNIVKNDLTIKTGDITAAGYGITGDTYIGAGVTNIDVGNIKSGNDGINVIHSGAGAATINAGDITSTSGRGIALTDDAAGFNPDATVGGVSVTVNNVSSKGNAIDVTAQVKQTPTVITANGTITATSGQGIALSQSNTGKGAADVTITANKSVTASATAINVSTSGLGDTTVQANDDVTGTAGYGVIVSKSGDGNAVIGTKGVVTARTGISLATSGNGNGTIHAEDVVNATAGTAIQVTGFGNGDLSIAADKGVVATGNGIDVSSSPNGAGNTGSVSITAGDKIAVGGVGINGDTGPNTTSSTISVTDIDAGSTGINWIHSGNQDLTVTATGLIKAGGAGITLNNDAAGRNAAIASNTVVNVAGIEATGNGANLTQGSAGDLVFTSTGAITSTNGVGINVSHSAQAGDTTLNIKDVTSGQQGIDATVSGPGKLNINLKGAIDTSSSASNHSTIGGDGIRATVGAAAASPLVINIENGSSITSYNNTMELRNNSDKGTIINVDGVLKSTANLGGSDGVIWTWNTPGTTTVNINDGSTVQAADSTGFAMTDNNGSSVVTVGKAAVTGGFRMGAGDDELTFNETDMTNVGTLDGGGGSTGGDVLTLNAIQNFTRRLQTAGQEIQNWDAVNLNGGTADLVGTMTTGTFTLGKDASGNPAALSIGAGHVGDTLTVTGNYVGAGGGITLDTDASTHSSDRLVVGGNVSGVTGLSLNDMTPTAAASDLQDIEVVDVSGASPNGAFVLANGPAVMGGRAYVLQQGNSAGANLLNWFLALQPCPAGGLNETNGATLGCKTDDTLVLDGNKFVAGNFEGGGGRDKLTVTGNASVGGIVAGGYAGADSSALLDDSDLIIINTTGSVGGVKGNLGDDVIYVVGSSTVKGNVEGNEGSNQIRIGGLGALPDGSVPTTDAVTVDGNVLGGDGLATDGNNQIWVLGGSHVKGNVVGGNGNDTIVLNGATAVIDGAIDGGAGNDTIALMKGTVGSVSGGDGDDKISLDGATVLGAIDAGEGNNIVTLNAGTASSVTAGAGADTITLAGATISGGINGGDGNNIIALNSGTASSVSTGSGADIITLAGATINGAINSGAGNDIINLISGKVTGGVNAGAGADTVNVAGATFTLGNTKLDGGAAGEGNTLNLNNVNQTLITPQSNLVNWDTVNVKNSTLTVSGGDSLKAADVNLVDSAFVAHNGFTVDGNLSLDRSMIDMQNGVAGSTFNVSGNYKAIGTGNTLKIDADFAANQADELKVGGTISGVTNLNVKDVTPVAATATGKDVLVAQAGVKADASNFKLVGGPIVNGIWDYDLANGTAANTVVLRGTLGPLAALYSAAAGALGDTFGAMPTLEERVGQRQWLLKNDGGVFDGLWVRFAGEHAVKTPAASSVSFSTLNEWWGVQAGADFSLFGNENGRLTAGITGQYKGMNAEVKPTSNDVGKIRAHGGGGGVNLTWNSMRGEYVDLQGQYNKGSATVGTTTLGDTMSGLGFDSKSASLEAGKRFVISADRKSVLVPQAQVTWSLMNSDPFTDNNGVSVDLGSYRNVVARAGLAYEFHLNGVNLMGPDKNGQMFYAIINVLRSLTPEHSSVAQNMTLNTRDEKTWGEIGLGGSYALSSNTLLYGQATYRQSLQSLSNSSNHGVGGTVGLRWSFGNAPKPLPPGPVKLVPEAPAAAAPAALPVAVAAPVVAPAPAPAPAPVVERIELKGVGFEVNSNKLTGDSRHILDDAAAALLPRMQRNPGLNVEVSGHTDASGKSERNVRLSLVRANAVREYLVSRGVDGSRLKAAGYGSSQPVASNRTTEGRARNRRVELKLIGE